MKSFLLFCTLMTGSQVYAQTVCMEITDAVSFSKISTNFDGSKTITKPQVKVNDQNMSISERSGTGFCKLLDLQFVSTVKGSCEVRTKAEIVKISSTGSMDGYEENNNGIVNSYGNIVGYIFPCVSQVICK